MKIISFAEIQNLGISPEKCIEWATTAIKNKNNYELPPKTSIKFNDSKSFFTTMPSMIHDENVFGIKMVSRLPDRSPSLKADILLYDKTSGELLTLMDGTWITTWRTGAVAAVTINSLKSNNTELYSFIGLGNTARSTLICLDAILQHKDINVGILSYKNQHELFIERFKSFSNIHFKIYKDLSQMVRDSDVVISCVTAMNDYFTDESNFRNGVLVVPVHTRGFQNCDLKFDRIFCDDIAHISSFKYFNQYKSVTEMTDVLNQDKIFIDTDRSKKRYIAYNVGISIQDIFFAKKIFDLIKEKDSLLEKKFWV